MRKYRYAPLASQIVGYMGAISKENQAQYTKKGYQLSDRVGVAGVESTYEDVLHGKPGYVKYAVDAHNRVLGVVERVDPVPGNDVQLTVDLKLQQYTEQILQAGIMEARTHLASFTNADLKAQANGQKYPAPAGAMVIEDPNNGEILGMASYPTFDNRWFIGDLPQAKYSALFPQTSDGSPLTNRAVAGAGYNIGSTMKLFTSIAALQSGALSSPNETYDDQGKYEIPPEYCSENCVFSNSGGLKPGRIDLQNAISMSSDDYFYRLGVSMLVGNSEKDVFQKTLYQFGFGSDTGIDLPFETSGLVPTKAVKKKLADLGVIHKDQADYFVGDSKDLAIGGGLFAASPLQLVNGYSTYANGGDRWLPHVGMAVIAAGAPSKAPGLVDMAQAQTLQIVDAKVMGHVDIQQSWRDAITRGLIGVTQKRTFPFGTAHRTFQNYNFAAFPIAAKTGTAQAGDRDPGEGLVTVRRVRSGAGQHRPAVHGGGHHREGRLRRRRRRPGREVHLRGAVGSEQDAARRAPAVGPARPQHAPGGDTAAAADTELPEDQPEPRPRRWAGRRADGHQHDSEPDGRAAPQAARPR